MKTTPSAHRIMRYLGIVACALLSLILTAGFSSSAEAKAFYDIGLRTSVAGLDGIWLNGNTLYMQPNGEAQISVTRYCYKGRKTTEKKVKASKVKWSSGKKSVATVNKKGVIKTKKAGRTRITAKYRFKKKTYVVRFTVKVVKSFSKGMNCNHCWEKEYRTQTEMVEQGPYDEWVDNGTTLSFCHCGLLFVNMDDYGNHECVFTFLRAGLDPVTGQGDPESFQFAAAGIHV